MKFLITDYAPNLADPDLCTEIDDDFVDDADDAVEKYAEDSDWSDGYDPRTVFVLDVERGITSEHTITVDFDPVYRSSPTRPGPIQRITWCRACRQGHTVVGPPARPLVEPDVACDCAGSDVELVQERAPR